MLSKEIRRDLQNILDNLLSPQRLPIDNIQIEFAIITILKGLLEIDRSSIDPNGDQQIFS